MIVYLHEKIFQEVGFPYIQRELTAAEPAPAYEHDPQGMAELRKVLQLVQQDDYYPTFEDKAAYLISSIAASQYFSNGNKRLSVVTLLMFLVANNAKVISDSSDVFREILVALFPAHGWEDNPNIPGGHALFLYNLATILGDRTVWGVDDFGDMRRKVAVIFRHIYPRAENERH